MDITKVAPSFVCYTPSSVCNTVAATAKQYQHPNYNHQGDEYITIRQVITSASHDFCIRSNINVQYKTPPIGTYTYYWVTQKLTQICTVILRICIICGNFWVPQYQYLYMALAIYFPQRYTVHKGDRAHKEQSQVSLYYMSKKQ